MTRRWYGRPNRPPENWDSPGSPAIRKVADDSGDLPKSKADLSKTQTPISVLLPNADWVTILHMLTVYEKAYGDDDWRKWCIHIREELTFAVNRYTDESRPSAAVLPIEDWRAIWVCMKKVCDHDSQVRRLWFDRLSKTMTQQIRG